MENEARKMESTLQAQSDKETANRVINEGNENAERMKVLLKKAGYLRMPEGGCPI
jgi:hypothetical protein